MVPDESQTRSLLPRTHNIMIGTDLYIGNLNTLWIWIFWNWSFNNFSHNTPNFHLYDPTQHVIANSCDIFILSASHVPLRDQNLLYFQLLTHSRFCSNHLLDHVSGMPTSFHCLSSLPCNYFFSFLVSFHSKL